MAQAVPAALVSLFCRTCGDVSALVSSLAPAIVFVSLLLFCLFGSFCLVWLLLLLLMVVVVVGSVCVCV